MSLRPTNAWYEPPRSRQAKLRHAARIVLVVALIFASAFAVEGVVWSHFCDAGSTAEWCRS